MESLEASFYATWSGLMTDKQKVDYIFGVVEQWLIDRCWQNSVEAKTYFYGLAIKKILKSGILDQ